MYILLIFQLAYSETYLLKEGQIKSLFFLPLNAYDIELHTDDDQWGICQLQKNRLDNEYYAYTSEQKILAMLTLSQHSLLIIDANLQLFYFQDQIPLWSQSLPIMETNDISLKYCQVTYQVYLISNMVYQFNPYEKNISEFQIFLTYRPQQIEIEDQYIFVLHDTKIQIYQQNQLFDTIELHNTAQISIFKVLINTIGGYSIYIVDKITGLCKIDWLDQQYTINQIDLIQNGVQLALLDEQNIFVVYKRQYKYIIAQYQIADQQLQIIKKISSKKPLIKIVTTKDYTLLVTKNKIDLLYQNQIYTILKYGIQDISLYGTKILGISQYDIFLIQFETLPSQVQCFYYVEEVKNIQYSIIYNEVNKTIHKRKFDFDIQLLTLEKNYTNIIVISSVMSIIFIITLIYSYMIFKKRTILINDLEKNLKKTKVKQVPLFKSLECVISPKNQHSKLQSFDQTSNFDLARMKN